MPSPDDQPPPAGWPHADPALGLVDGLAQLSFLVQNALAGIAAQHDLSIIQTRLLGVLRDREPTMNALGGLLGLDKSSISGLVDRAQRRGLVTRTVSATDRRVFQVSITDAGRQLADQVAASFTGRIETPAAGPAGGPDRGRRRGPPWRRPAPRRRLTRCRCLRVPRPGGAGPARPRGTPGTSESMAQRGSPAAHG